MEHPSHQLTAGSARIVPWLVATAFFMQMLDGTIMNIALPDMARSFGVAPLRMQSVVIAYLLTAALLIPASGWCADRFGTRKVFFTAIVIFTLGSLFCAMSTSLELLVLSRVIQAVGGALMVPVGRLTVLRVFPRRDLVRILSFVTIPAMLGPLLGPVAGGFLVQYASWHWIFLINIPVGAIGALCTLIWLPDLKDTAAGRFDIKGFLIFGASMVLISVAMEGFGELHLPRVEATVLCILGLMLMALYWLRCARMEHPLFSAALFRTRSYAVGLLGNLFSRLGAGAMPFLLPLFLQLALGLSPFLAGLYMAPIALAGIAAKQIINRLVERVGFRQVLVVNTLALGVLIGCFALIEPATPRPLLLALLAGMGVVNSLQFTAMSSMTLIELPEHQAGSGNSLLSVAMQLAGSIGIAMAAALYSGFSEEFAAAPAHLRMLETFHATFLVVGLLNLVTMFLFFQVPRELGRIRTPAAPVAEEVAARPS